jgi:hypothetical protein
MRTRLTLFPGQNGTKDSSSSTAIVWCVRYRYDAEKKRRYKTVELIIVGQLLF